MIKGNLVAKSGRYYAVYRINKKQHWKSLGLPVNGRNKKKAEQAMLELLSKVEQEQILHSTETLVGYLENWLKESKGLFKPSTWESYGKTINGKILPYFKTRNMFLNELTPGVFTEYFQYLKELGRSDGRGGLSKKTVTNIKNVLSSALEDARRNKIIDVNPIFESRLPSFENEIKKERVFYTADQLKKLLDYAKSSGSHMYIYLLLSSHSGLRRGELLALKWSCIDFKNNAVHIIQNRTGSRKEVTKLLITPKSKSSVRTLILPESVMEELRKEKLRHEELDKILGPSVGQDYVVRTVDVSRTAPSTVRTEFLTDWQKLAVCRTPQPTEFAIRSLPCLTNPAVKSETFLFSSVIRALLPPNAFMFTETEPQMLKMP